MAQQPNVEIGAGEKPRATPEPGPAVKWRAQKPGVPATPQDVPRGGSFGSAGPDAGWGLRILREVDLPGDDERLRDVVTGLVLARAAGLGRAPVPEDIDVALVLCGFGDGSDASSVERLQRWLEATAHDVRPGQTAVSEVDRDLIVNKPEQVRYAMRLADQT